MLTAPRKGIASSADGAAPTRHRGRTGTIYETASKSKLALGPGHATLEEMGPTPARRDLGFDCGGIDHLLLTPRVRCLKSSRWRSCRPPGSPPKAQDDGAGAAAPQPGSFAKEWATLDLLSGGRSILGVGVGWHEEEFALMGSPYRERGRRMDEMLEAVTALWAGDNVTYQGKYYRFSNLTIDPKPAQKPHPPIWIGGGTQPSEKIYAQTVSNIDPVLRRIARYAKTWVPHSSSTAEMVRGDWEKIQRFMGELGRTPSDMTKVYSNFVVPGKPSAPKTVCRTTRSTGMDLPYGGSGGRPSRSRRDRGSAAGGVGTWC